MKMRNLLISGGVSLVAAAALAGPAYAAPGTVAQAAALKADKCSLHVNIAHPVARDTETLTVDSTAGKSLVAVNIHYKTVSHTWNIRTAANGKATYSFGVGRPTKNYRVTLDGTVLVAPRGYRTGATCSTSFVPE
jgi:hypothetical protein